MRALVIGGAGYIGSHVVRELLDAGMAVTVFDNLSSGRRCNLVPEAAFVEADILDYQALLAAMGKGFDAVFHFAAFKAAGESMVEPQKYSQNNITGTLNILNAVTRSGIRNFIFSSSAAVYGEPAYLPIDEQHPTSPENYYGFTKLEIERFLSWYDRLCGLKFAALRYFNAAGYDPRGRVSGLERNPQNLLPCVMEAACGMRPALSIFGDDYPTPDGTGIRDYVHVTDLAVAHVKACEYLASERRSLTVNLGSETGISVKEMVDTARRITGKPFAVKVTGRRDGDTARLYASAKKAGELLGWKAQYSDVDTLIRTTWSVYAAQCGG